MYENKKIAVIIAAAGKGTRVGGPVPKQYLKIGGEPVILKTLKAFAALDEVDHIFIVTNEEYMDRCQEIVRDNGLDKVKGIVKGGADKSYGIQVAKLAGVPDVVIERAKELVEELSDADITATVKDIALERKKGKTKAKSQVHLDEVDLEQISLFDTVKDGDVLEELKNIDVSNLTPIDALNTIYKLQNKLKNRW